MRILIEVVIFLTVLAIFVGVMYAIYKAALNIKANGRDK